MDDVRISRRWLVGAGAVGTLGMLLGPDAAFANDDDREPIHRLRWDLVQVFGGVVVPAGTDVGIITAPGTSNGDTVTLTGSGLANPLKGTATGGGTFLNRHASGVESAHLGHGIYFVTGFNSFVNGGGSLAGTGLTDTIGNINRTTGGVLSLNVLVVAAPKAGSPPGTPPDKAPGVLEIHCSLPGGQPTTEGIVLTLGKFNFVQDTGATLFHVIDDDDS
jgi:hypothetical protein